MEELIIHPYLLALIFFVVSAAYSSIGLGGGSSYTAIMAILGVGYVFIPTISLSLNVLVSTIGSYNFIRRRHGRLDLIVPFFVTSIPMAYIGGSLDMPKRGFYIVLLVSLVFVAVRIYFWKKTSLNLNLTRGGRIAVSLVFGALLGLVSGIAGIGGGIYLVPIIIILGLGSEKEAAASGAIFVWINSVSGLAARLSHHQFSLLDMLPLAVAVIIGGSIGSHLGSSKLAPATMEKVLGAIILVAIAFLIKKTFLM